MRVRNVHHKMAISNGENVKFVPFSVEVELKKKKWRRIIFKIFFTFRQILNTDFLYILNYVSIHH